MPSDVNAAGNRVPPATSGTRERQTVVWLCLVAAIHAFVFSAAFPFFTNLDEPAQFDLAIKYSHGHLPNGNLLFSPDSSPYLTLFSSCAYMATPDMFPNHKIPDPLWTESPDRMRHDFAVIDADWQKQKNYEISQAPLYYMLAGLWWRAGQCLGFHDGRLLYWLRFLNVVLVVGLVWIGYRTARIVFPENSFGRFAVPALLALISQSAFYSIENDILSAVTFGLLFFCLLKSFAAEEPKVWDGIAVGAAFAATYLAKATNLPLLAVTAAILLIMIYRALLARRMRSLFPFFGAFLTIAVPPIVAWMAWSKLNFGDIFGSRLKMDQFGWTIKPFPQWWHHPIFSPQGLWTYFYGQMGTFWQGELMWHNKNMPILGTNTAYSLFSLAMLFAALPAVVPNSSGIAPLQRQALRWALACFAVILAFFAFLSIIYDFHDCCNPSRAWPYFQAGRMMLGVLIPFLVLIVFGLDRLLNRFGNPAKYIALTAIISGMLVVEVVTDWPVFSNPFNWFHLP